MEMITTKIWRSHVFLTSMIIKLLMRQNLFTKNLTLSLHFSE